MQEYEQPYCVLFLQEEEISMLGEITHLQTISDDLKSLTMDPHKLPSSSEQVRSPSLEKVLLLLNRNADARKGPCTHIL